MTLPKVGVEMVAENSNPFLRAIGDGDKAMRGLGSTILGVTPSFSKMDGGATGALMHIGAGLVNLAADAGRLLGSIATGSIDMAGEFEATVNSFASVAGPLDDAGLSLKDFENKFLDLGAATKFSANEAAQAAVELAKGGVPVSEIMGDATDATLALAAAGELELAPAANIVAKQLGVWGDTGVTATDAANLLAKAANASTVDVEELALGMANVGGTAKVAGVSFEETVQTLALLAPGFSSAADASTSMKTMLSRLIPTTKDATGMMINLGLYSEETGSKFYDTTGSFVGMEQAAALLNTATKDLSEEQKLLAFQTIFGADAIRAASMVAEAGADGYNRMGASMDTAGDVFAQAAKKNEGYKASVEAMKGSFESLQIVVGQKVLPTLTPLVRLVTDGINVFFEMARGTDGAAKAIDTFHTNLSTMSPILGKWFDVLTTNDSVLDSLAFIVGDIASRFGPLGTTAQNLINIFLRGQDTLANWTFLGRSLGGVFGSELGGTLTTLFQHINEGIGLFTNLGGAILDTGFNSSETRQALGLLVSEAGPAIAGAIPQIRQAFLDWALVAAQWALDAVPGLLAGLETLGQAAIGWVVQNAITFGTQMLEFGKKAVEWIAPQLPELGNQLGAFLDRMVTWVVDSLPAWVAQLQTLGMAAIDWVTAAAPGLANNLGLFAGNLLGWIVKTTGEAIPKLAELGLKFVGWVVTDVLPKLPGALLAIWEGLDTFIATTAEKAVTALANLGAKFNEWVAKDVIPYLPATLELIWETIKGWVGGVVGKVKTKLKEIGTAIIDGITEGVKAAAGRLYDATVGAVWDAITGSQKEIDSHSPSRVTFDLIGTPLMDGITEGVLFAAPALESALVSSLTTAMDAGKMIARAGAATIGETLGGISGAAQIAAFQAAMGSVRPAQGGLGEFGSGGGHRIQPVMTPSQIGSQMSITNNGPQISYAPTYHTQAPPPALDFGTLQALTGGL